MRIIWKVLWPRFSEHKLKFFLAFVFALSSSALQATLPELMRLLIDEGWTNGNKKLAFLIPLLLSVVWVSSSAGRFFQTLWIRQISILLISRLRCQLMDKYLNSSLYRLQMFSSHSGKLISRLINDLNQVYEGLCKLSELLRNPLLVILVFFYLLYLNFVLTFFIIIIFFLTSWAVKRIAKSLRKYVYLNQETMEDLSVTLKESLDGIRIVQAFNLQSEMSQRFRKQSESYCETRFKVILREIVTSPVFNIITSFIMTCLMYYINYLIFKKQFTVGQFTSFLTGLIILVNGLRTIQSSYVDLQQAAVSLDRFQNLIQSDLEVPEASSTLPFPKKWSEIEFKNISFSYTQKDVLKSIHFKVKRGDIVAIVGQSGSGKSTLVNLLLRFFDPREGEILIGRVPLRDIALKSLRENVSLVSQEVFLFKDTIEKNILASHSGKTLSDVKEASHNAGADEFIENFEKSYETQVGEKGFNLSGGERQRISIARAFLKNAPILILDEPTSALDSENEKKIQKSLTKLMKGRTTFIITHRVSMISQAQKILVLKGGNLVEKGSHESLYSKKGEYFSMYQNLK